MSSTTKNLGLFKYDTDIDIDEVFSIEQALNDNWDIIDSAIPTKTSQLVNDSGFLTSHQSLSNYVNLNGAQTISGAKTFTGVTKVPASTTAGTALQLAAVSKAANGYIKFGTGVIIQWGASVTSSGSPHSVTFPTSFSGTNYYAQGNITHDGYTANGWGYLTSKTKTGVKFSVDDGDKFCWIAIGY